MLSTLEIY